MASGVVTVAGDNPGYTGLMQEIGTLSLANPKDTSEFARRMKLLLDEEKLRLLWQKWAHSYVKQFSYNNIVRQYEQLYRKALKKHASSKITV
jgi:glycosyltransferase involved in cell wall biosynthesis